MLEQKEKKHSCSVKNVFVEQNMWQITHRTVWKNGVWMYQERGLYSDFEWVDLYDLEREKNICPLCKEKLP